jgi:hypothetical protein
MKTCERCHKSFSCGAGSTGSPCWCTELPAVSVPKNFKDCLCPDCLKLFVKPESEDFYLDENGNTVFTEAYHKKRGYCCNSNCRHCPY